MFGSRVRTTFSYLIFSSPTKQSITKAITPIPNQYIHIRQHKAIYTRNVCTVYVYIHRETERKRERETWTSLGWKYMKRKYPATTPIEIPTPNPQKPNMVLKKPISNLLPKSQTKTSSRTKQPQITIFSPSLVHSEEFQKTRKPHFQYPRVLLRSLIHRPNKPI